MLAHKRRAPREKRVQDAPLLVFSMEDEIAQLKKEPEWLSQDRNSVTLAKTPDFGIVLVALRKGATICGHEVDGPITVLLLAGTIRLGTDGVPATLKGPALATVGKQVPHHIEALEDSELLLTIVRNR